MLSIHPQTGHHIVQAIFVVAGLVTLLAACLDWEWFFSARNARFLTGRLGRRGARIAYALLGILLMGMGVCFFLLTKEVGIGS